MLLFIQRSHGYLCFFFSLCLHKESRQIWGGTNSTLVLLTSSFCIQQACTALSSLPSRHSDSKERVWTLLHDQGRSGFILDGQRSKYPFHISDRAMVYGRMEGWLYFIRHSVTKQRKPACLRKVLSFPITSSTASIGTHNQTLKRFRREGGER